jgi:hypothetical protein
VLLALTLNQLQSARGNSSYTGTERLLTRVIRMTIGAGGLTSTSQFAPNDMNTYLGVLLVIAAGIEIVLFLAFPDTNMHLAIAAIIGKIFTNSFFVLINSRQLERMSSDSEHCGCSIPEVTVSTNRPRSPIAFARTEVVRNIFIYGTGVTGTYHSCRMTMPCLSSRLAMAWYLHSVKALFIIRRPKLPW